MKRAFSFAPISPALRVGMLFLIFGLGLYFESRRPLRRPTQAKTRRILINLALASIAAIALRFTFYPVVMALAFWVEDSGYGLLHWLNAPALATTILSIVLLDCTLYYWHWSLHKIPFLWRFHNVHHVDLDLDTSTALRFHLGELAISTLYRSAQIFIFGIDPFNLALFELLITSFAQFHHSNVRLQPGFERILSRLIITPRIHGVHHSTVRAEADSNFGTIFSSWDFLHRTFKGNVRQSGVKIGVPSYQDPRELGVWGSLSLPFRQQRPWVDVQRENPSLKSSK